MDFGENYHSFSYLDGKPAWFAEENKEMYVCNFRENKMRLVSAHEKMLITEQGVTFGLSKGVIIDYNFN